MARKGSHVNSQLAADFLERNSDIPSSAALQNASSRVIPLHSLTSAVPSGLSTPQLSSSSDLASKDGLLMGHSPNRLHVDAAQKLFDMPSCDTTNILRQKIGGRSESFHLKKLVSRLLCSFAERMMEKQHNCPPFIHPSILATPKIASRSVDPIASCRDIFHHFSLHRIASDTSFWDVVAQEQEKIYDLRFSPNKWVHLASAQAITIYLLLLISNRENVLMHHPNLPITLLFTLRTTFEQLHRILSGYTAPTKQNTCKPAWEDWIFAESKLRTAIVYFILASCYDVSYGLPCDREIDHTFHELELPVTKSLWETTDEVAWNEAADLTTLAENCSHTVGTSETRLKYGDLVGLNKSHSDIECPGGMNIDSTLGNRIETWHKEMDELGMLIMGD